MPVVRGWASANDEEAAAYLVASNRLTEVGGWDDGELVALLQQVATTDLGLAGVGYSSDDLDQLLIHVSEHDRQPASAVDPDEVPEPPREPITRRGDVWLLGESHRLMCGDSRDAEDVAALLDGAMVNVAFTSPPYADRRKYDESSGFRPIHPDQYVEWFQPVAENVATHLAEDGSWFVNIKEHCEDGQRLLYVKDLVLAHVREWDWFFVDELCWNRGGMPGTWPNRFKNAWESVLHFARGPHIKFRPERNGHYSDDVIRHDPSTHIGFTREDGRVNDGGTEPVGEPGIALPSNVITIRGGGDGSHVAAFPVNLPAWFIRAYSDPGDVVYDPFVGSGSTILAAHQEDRRGYGMEISPAYCDVTAARFQRISGEKPVLEATGEPHDFLAAEVLPR